MTESFDTDPGRRDLLSLATAPLTDLLEAIESAETIAEPSSGIPARATQMARLVVAEVVRLIRLGTRRQLAEAGDLLSRTLIGAQAPALAECQPQAHDLLCAAANVLDLAIAPSSSGGELTVLRSWGGNARRAVALVDRAPGRAIARARLREALKLEDSYLSHMLAELEAAGLIVRTRLGRVVTVHLGPVAERPHVKELLPGKGDKRDDDLRRLRTRRADELFKCLLEDRSALAGSDIRGLADLEEQLDQLAQELEITEWVTHHIADPDEVVCHVQIHGITGRRRVERKAVWVTRFDDELIGEVSSWSPLEPVDFQRKQSAVEAMPLPDEFDIATFASTEEVFGEVVEVYDFPLEHLSNRLDGPVLVSPDPGLDIDNHGYRRVTKETAMLIGSQSGVSYLTELASTLRRSAPK